MHYGICSNGLLASLKLTFGLMTGREFYKWAVFTLCMVPPFVGRVSIWQQYEWKCHLKVWFLFPKTNDFVLGEYIVMKHRNLFDCQFDQGSNSKWRTVQRVNGTERIKRPIQSYRYVKIKRICDRTSRPFTRSFRLGWFLLPWLRQFKQCIQGVSFHLYSSCNMSSMSNFLAKIRDETFFRSYFIKLQNTKMEMVRINIRFEKKSVKC